MSIDEKAREIVVDMCKEAPFAKHVDAHTIEYIARCAINAYAHESAKSAEQPVAITDDILEAVLNEHDMNVPDGLLASPGGFGAHREAMRKALKKIIPLTLHIEAEYKRAMTRETGAVSAPVVEGDSAFGYDVGTRGDHSCLAIRKGQTITCTLYGYQADAVLELLQSTQPAKAAEGWQPIETAPLNTIILVHYKNGCGKSRVIKARYITKFTEENHSGEDWCDYNEASDTYYDPEGWYEEIDNWPDYSHVAFCGNNPDAWQPLPTPPIAEGEV